MDGLLQQFISAGSFDKIEFLRRCQREFRDRLAPMLEERDQLLVDNDILKKQVEQLCAELDALKKKGGKHAA